MSTYSFTKIFMSLRSWLYTNVPTFSDGMKVTINLEFKSQAAHEEFYIHLNDEMPNFYVPEGDFKLLGFNFETSVKRCPTCGK